jgi:hypothetical protein
MSLQDQYKKLILGCVLLSDLVGRSLDQHARTHKDHGRRRNHQLRQGGPWPTGLGFHDHGHGLGQCLHHVRKSRLGWCHWCWWRRGTLDVEQQGGCADGGCGCGRRGGGLAGGIGGYGGVERRWVVVDLGKMFGWVKEMDKKGDMYYYVR